jgi:hypothetical protein
VVARNSGTYGDDCAGVITSQGHNLIGDPTGCSITLRPTDQTGDPGLHAFIDNGQPGSAHYLPLPDSRDGGVDAADLLALAEAPFPFTRSANDGRMVGKKQSLDLTPISPDVVCALAATRKDKLIAVMCAKRNLSICSQ